MKGKSLVAVAGDEEVMNNFGDGDEDVTVSITFEKELGKVCHFMNVQRGHPTLNDDLPYPSGFVQAMGITKEIRNDEIWSSPTFWKSHIHQSLNLTPLDVSPFNI